MTTWLVALLAGGAVALAMTALWGLVRDLGSAETAYRDQPPPGFRLAWPVVNIMGNTFGSLLGRAREEAITARLQRAGQSYALTAWQFFGGKLVAMIVAGVGAAVLAGLSWKWCLAVAVLGYKYPDIWLSDHTKKRNLAILKALPFMLDIVTLSIEAGLNLTSALAQAIAKAPANPLKFELQRVMRDIRTGRPRLEARILRRSRAFRDFHSSAGIAFPRRSTLKPPSV